MYCLDTDVLAILPGMPQTTTAAGYTSTLAVIDAHIIRADAVINGKCARRYALPFSDTATSTPPLIRQLSQDLTSWFTYRSLFTRDSVNKNDYLAELADGAMKILDEIRDGKIDIATSTGSVLSEINATSKVYSTTEQNTPFFGPDNETSWGFDKNLIDAWGSARNSP